VRRRVHDDLRLLPGRLVHHAHRRCPGHVRSVRERLVERRLVVEQRLGLQLGLKLQLRQLVGRLPARRRLRALRPGVHDVGPVLQRHPVHDGSLRRTRPVKGPMPRKSPAEVETQAGVPEPESGEVSASDFAPGHVLGGKYLVEQVLGIGGLGVVLKATHQQLDQPVAIKFLKPSMATRPDVVERFQREARLAASIKNEHAVKVHDVDAAPSGVPYMVMEYLEGRDLDRVIAASPVPFNDSIDYVLQACEALAEAHAAGIVHRDLKPANLFLASRPGNTSIVKVLDFGISKVVSSDPESRRVTRVDERLGTPVYMSPELLQTAPDVDARSDVWALGVVLYELLSGALPFDGPELPQVCAAILTKPPVPLSAVYPDATPELEQVIARCLEKDRSKRYQNVAELAQDLVQIWEGDTPSRVNHIAQVIAEAGQKVDPPPPPVKEAASASVSDDQAWLAAAANVVLDNVLAVFTDGAGAVVDELEFLSIDEAYDYAESLGADAVRCELYDQFAGVRGRLRATYVRKPEDGLWVPVIP
jgi:serine/threonine-protein kinase